MRFVADNFERVVVMRNARVILDGPPHEVFAEPNWRALKSTNLGPPYAAEVGHRLGLGSTPTAAAVVRELQAAQPR
jgi:energy-coupling factor transporter ATP-binding protein EcfA2